MIAHQSRVRAPAVTGERGGESRSLPIPDSIHSLSEAFEYLERRVLAAELAEVLGEYIAEHFIPVHFVTLTLRDLVVEEQRIPAGSAVLERSWKRFCRHCRPLNGEALEYLRVVEYQRRGVPHIHALTVNTARLIGLERSIQEWCWIQFGKSQLLRYRASIGAGGYLGKYLGKDSRVQVSTSRALSQYSGRSLLRSGACASTQGEPVGIESGNK